MRHPCAYCEAEYKTPNLGRSHGICDRHKDEQWAAIGKKAPPSSTKSQTVDLRELSPEEIQLATKLFSIVKEKITSRDDKRYST
jgi:hypothetical protein